MVIQAFLVLVFFSYFYMPAGAHDLVFGYPLARFLLFYFLISGPGRSSGVFMTSMTLLARYLAWRPIALGYDWAFDQAAMTT